MVYSFNMNQAGSLYQSNKANSYQVGNKEVIVPTAETNTISDVSFQQSLQETSSNAAIVNKETVGSNHNWPSPSSQSFFDHEKTYFYP